jgi:hypothetical protein
VSLQLRITPDPRRDLRPDNVIGPVDPRGKYYISIRVVVEPTAGQYLRETQGKDPHSHTGRTILFPKIKK